MWDAYHLIKIELLSETNFCIKSLDLYNRKQEVNKVYRRIDGEYTLVECKYTEDWDLNQKRSVAKQISSDDYITYIALENDKVVGFIGLLKQLNGPYMILDMMQVSSECRGQGIGRRLFEAGKAKQEKLVHRLCTYLPVLLRRRSHFTEQWEVAWQAFL